MATSIYPITDTGTIEGYSDASIVIERREIIATIEYNDHGNRPMLSIAFETACDFMANNLQGDAGMSLEFVYGKHRFQISAEPVKS